MSERVHSVTGEREIPMKLWYGYADGWLTPGQFKERIEADILLYIKRNPIRARQMHWGMSIPSHERS